MANKSRSRREIDETPDSYKAEILIGVATAEMNELLNICKVDGVLNEDKVAEVILNLSFRSIVTASELGVSKSEKIKSKVKLYEKLLTEAYSKSNNTTDEKDQR